MQKNISKQFSLKKNSNKFSFKKFPLFLPLDKLISFILHFQRFLCYIVIQLLQQIHIQIISLIHSSQIIHKLLLLHLSLYRHCWIMCICIQHNQTKSKDISNISGVTEFHIGYVYLEYRMLPHCNGSNG